MRKARVTRLAALLALGASTVLVLPAGCGFRTSSPEAGAPITCMQVMDCPVSTDPCIVSTCFEERCLSVAAAVNTVVKEQKAGDCHMRVCDGNGAIMEIDDDVDTPPDDGNACTESACKQGAAVQEPVAVGEACGDTGVCNGKGACGACLPGARKCDKNSIASCDEDGKWANEACTAAAPICQNARCIGPTRLSAGHAVTCAMFEDGSTRCFGASGAIREGSSATQVGSLLGAEELAVGAYFSCARVSGGSIYCWGDNTSGQIGDGSKEPERPPSPVIGLSGATSLAAGDAHACAILAGGKVACWGRDADGRLGVPASKAAAKPPKTPENEDEESFSPGDPPSVVPAVFGQSRLMIGARHACGLWPGGRVGCFGEDEKGQLGGGYSPNPSGKPGPKPKPTFVLVKGLENAKQLALGSRHSCALLDDGKVRCWGDNSLAQLGDGTTSPRTAPVEVKDLSDVRLLAAGARHTCALLQSGSVRCWGDNTHGQLGDGTTEPRTSPVSVVSLSGARSLVSGGDHNCVMQADQSALCWGGNGAGEVGDGAEADRPAPTPVRW